MFLGEYQHSLDNKNRLIIPARFRDNMGLNCIITLGLDGCMFLFPQKEWQKLTDKLSELSLARRDARLFSRFFFSNASDVFFDKQGRIQVPVRLTKKLDFNKEVVIIGVGNRLELWDKEKWNAFCSDEGENSYEQLAELIADMGLPL